MKRLQISYKGQRYLADSKEAIAFRIQKDKGISFEEAFDYVNKNIRPNKEEPGFFSEPLKKSGKRLSEYVDGALAIVSVASGQYATQEEINRRAGICTNCPLVEEIPGCRGCGMASKLIKVLNKARELYGKAFTIPNNLEGHGCGACGCSLTVMLPAKITLFKESDQTKRPNHCWVKKTSPNYRP